jgi:hypothetical protein
MESKKSPTESTTPTGPAPATQRLFANGDLLFLSSKLWWQESLRTAWTFAPFCIKPAAVLAVAHILLLAVVHLLSRPSLLTAYTPQDMTAESLKMLVLIGIGAIIALLAGLALSLWALTEWANSLTAVAHACLGRQGSPDEAAFRQSLNWVKRKRGYITKVWLYGAIFMLVPIFPGALLLAHKWVFSAEWIQLGVPQLPLPAWALFTVSFVTSDISFAYLFALLVFSAMSTLTPFGTAWKALSQSLPAAPKLLLLTAVVMVVNYVMSAPHALLIGTPIPDMVLQNLLLSILAQIWLSITSCLLWPWSVLPYCRLAGPQTT